MPNRRHVAWYVRLTIASGQLASLCLIAAPLRDTGVRMERDASLASTRIDRAMIARSVVQITRQLIISIEALNRTANPLCLL
jgi:hypothetical protein